METTIYSATGCVRCKITKNYLNEQQIPFKEFDFKAEGKEEFAQFYRTNRKQIFRDQDGVEFPVYYNGSQIKQGVSVILGYLIAGDGLSGFIHRNQQHGEWIDGFDISAGDPRTAEIIKDASGSNKLPYVLKPFDHSTATDELFKNLEPLPTSALFKYRTQARRFQVLSEIEK
ncbi:MAG: hypothetical protein HQ517_09795 [SAR324 cluster bacterium]|nr:hypothetical protein [SAR324 cluster bacterium]